MPDIEPKQNWYFTFGFGQGHDNCYHKTYGTFHEARSIMVARFGMKWCMQYDEEKFLPQITKYNLRQVM